MTIKYLAKLPRPVLESYLMQANVSRASGVEAPSLGSVLADSIAQTIAAETQSQETAVATKEWPGQKELAGAFVIKVEPNPDFDFVEWRRAMRYGKTPKTLSEAKADRSEILGNFERISGRGTLYQEAHTSLNTTTYDQTLKTQFKHQKELNALYENADYCSYIVAQAMNDGVIDAIGPRHGLVVTPDIARKQILRNMAIGVVPAKKENAAKAQTRHAPNTEPYLVEADGTRIFVKENVCMVECDIDAHIVQQVAAKAEFFDRVLWSGGNFENKLTENMLQTIQDQKTFLSRNTKEFVLCRRDQVFKASEKVTSEPVVTPISPQEMFAMETAAETVPVEAETTGAAEMETVPVATTEKEFTVRAPVVIPPMTYAATIDDIVVTFDKIHANGKEFCHEVVGTAHGRSALSLAYSLNFRSAPPSEDAKFAQEYNSQAFKALFSDKDCQSIDHAYGCIKTDAAYTLYDNDLEPIDFKTLEAKDAKERISCLLATSALLIENGTELLPRLNLVKDSVIQKMNSHYIKTAPKHILV